MSSVNVVLEELRKIKEEMGIKKENNNNNTLNHRDLNYIPTLYDLTRYFENVIIRGENRSIVENKKVRLNALLLWFIGNRSVLLIGESGTAKTRIAEAIVNLCFGEEAVDTTNNGLYVLTSSSDKAEINAYTIKLLTESTHAFIPEFQKVRNHLEMLKTWAEGRSFTYSRLIGFEKYNYELPPKPMLTSIATDNEFNRELNNEIKRRFFPLNTESSIELTKRVKEEKAKNSFLGKDKILSFTEKELNLMRRHFKTIKRLNISQVKNICGQFIDKFVPNYHINAMSFADVVYYAFIPSITIFNAKNRIKYKNSLLSTIEDNWLAMELILEQFYEACYGVPPFGLKILDIIPILETEKNFGDLITSDVSYLKTKAKTTNDIIEEVIHLGYNLDEKQIKTALYKLQNATLIFEVKVGKSNAYYRRKGVEIQKIDWNEVRIKTIELVKQSFEPIADEYIKRFCDINQMFIQPTTGELINIYETKSQMDIVDIDNKEKINSEDDLSEEIKKELRNILENNKGIFNVYMPRNWFLNTLRDRYKHLYLLGEELLGKFYDDFMKDKKEA